MNKRLLIGAAALVALPLLASAASPKEQITQAAEKLAAKSNYSWRTTVEVPESSRFRPGPTEGKTEKDGFTHVTMSFGDNTTEAVLHGDKAAVSSADEGWRLTSELASGEGRGRFMARMVEGIEPPAKQAAKILAHVKDLKQEGDMITGALSEEGVKELLRFGRGGQGPEISGAKGSAKFWIKDGVLAKYEYRTEGTMNFNGNDFDVGRTTTVEIKEVGTTKMTIPEAARQKLS